MHSVELIPRSCGSEIQTEAEASSPSMQRFSAAQREIVFLSKRGLYHKIVT